MERAKDDACRTAVHIDQFANGTACERIKSLLQERRTALTATIPRRRADLLHLRCNAAIDPARKSENAAQSHTASWVRVRRLFDGTAQRIHRKRAVSLDHDVAVVIAEFVQDQRGPLDGRELAGISFMPGRHICTP